MSVFAALASAQAAEGPAALLNAAPISESRSARYTQDDVTAKKQLPASQASKSRTHASVAKPAEDKTLRALQPQKSAHASDFYFFDASSTLLTDRDEDGHASEFRIRFDADSLIGDVLVYARLYVRRLGNTEWELYHTTDDFWLEGESDSDDYYVTTTLDHGYPTAEYEVLIDLHEVGYEDIVATIDPYEAPALAYLPLEEMDLDIPIELGGYQIDEITATLLIDEDGDGHYSQFRIALNPDSDLGTNLVYAKVWVRAEGGDWIEEHTSPDFFVNQSGNADTYSFTVDWLSGYPTAYYDMQIDLYESASGLLIASAGSDWSALAQLPLEDQARDIRPNPPVYGGGGGSSNSRESGGGAMSWFLLLLAPLIWARKVMR
jgi:hypothetical protein